MYLYRLQIIKGDIIKKNCIYLCCEFLVSVGVAETSSSVGIDVMNPSSMEEFDEFQTAISKKIQLYTKSPHFPTFAEDLIRNVCVNCKYTNEMKINLLTKS
jgi:hypothetical protein